MKLLISLVVVSGFLLPAYSFASNSDTIRLDYVKRRLISSKVSKVEVNKLLFDKRLNKYPIKTVAYKEPDWKIIENKLFSMSSVEKGAQYILDHKAVFDKAEIDFGVKKEAIAGVIAIETDFGRNSGNYIVFNVIYSRMQQWPKEKWMGQARELIALSKYCLSSKIDCFSIKGSYAGALGIVQFMPSSLMEYGVDGDGDGIIDLLKPADAIPSAANFLKTHGWSDNQLKALTRYYGSSVGYPGIVLTYADLLANKPK